MAGLGNSTLPCTDNLIEEKTEHENRITDRTF